MADVGHKDSWSSPDGGWPTFCQWCGKRISDVCWTCDSLLYPDHEEHGDE